MYISDEYVKLQRVVAPVTPGLCLQRAVSLFTNFTFCNSRITFEMIAMAKK